MKWTVCGFLFFWALLSGASAVANYNSAKNVLILDSVGSPSHQVWMHRLTRSIAADGYNVTTLTCGELKNPPENVKQFPLENFFQVEGEEEMNFFELTELGPWGTFAMLTAFLVDGEQMAIKSKALKEVMNYPKEFKFDLIVYDYLGPAALLVLADRFPEARLIGVCAYPAIEYSDKYSKGPRFASFVPNIYMEEVKETFLGRLESFLLYTLNDLIVDYHYYPKLEQVVKKEYKTSRKIKEIIASTEILMANHNPVMDVVQPILPSVIPVGGLQIEDPKPLPKDLEEIYQSAKRGVIFFSLGSNVKCEQLGRERLEAITAALAKFPEYNFIWKIDLTGLDLEIPSNVFIKRWLPQNDILADKRTKLFISHAGGLSTQEASWHGMPMLALPVMVDQFMVSGCLWWKRRRCL